jgi:hypothetical protein
VATRVVAVVVVLLLAGCQALSIALPDPSRAPRQCGTVFSIERCDALLVAAAITHGIAPEDVINIQILPPPTPRTANGQPDPRIRVGLLTADGRTAEALIACGRPSTVPACMDEPRIFLTLPGDTSYFHYLPGATPVPAIDPKAAAAANPLDIHRLDIPILETGPHRLLIGHATLANGIIRGARAELADDWPANVLLLGEIRIEIVTTAGGDRITNRYAHGWQPGVEPVDVFVVFEPIYVQPGAMLTLLNVLVR